MSLQTPAPLFVGGGTIEGHLLLTVDGGSARKTKLKPLSISRLSIDIVGVEEVTDGRRWIFLSLATELFDAQHPPPGSLVATQVPASGTELSWPLRSASVVIPFCLNLPLNIGPPPYASKQAHIRYVLCATAHIKPAGKLSLIRHSFEIQMLTVYDPEKALSSLPTPLLATDQLSMPHGIATHNIKLTAGLHRQTWVNGAMIFVDVHIMNNSSKTIKKIEVQLEKTTLWYSHAAAGTIERSATHLRLPKRSDNELVCSSIIKKSKEWKGVLPNISEVRTCDLEIPRGHVTISTGRYFEVRYFLNIIITVTMFKTIAVQLPVTIIHLNSLDIVPNSLAQVAASIEAKRARTVPVANDAILPSFHQGQAFTAPRRQSLERMRRASSGLAMDDLAALAYDLDASPRRFARASTQGHRHKMTMSAAFSAENHTPGRLSTAASSHHHHTRHNSCYHCHLQEADTAHHGRRKSSMSSLPGPKLPRLQLSTSGLGFSDSEFEIGSDSPPRKVMLSESERKFILQQREIKLQRQLSQNNQNQLGQQQALQRQPSVAVLNGVVDALAEKKRRGGGPAGGYRGWRNVAAQSMALSGGAAANYEQENQGSAAAYLSVKGMNKDAAGSTRSRSNTGPGRMGMSVSGPSMSMRALGSGHGQGQRMTKGSADPGVRKRSHERARVPLGGGGGAAGPGFRKSVENW
jgi:Arrestin (or S-antigen), C-terminal domain